MPARAEQIAPATPGSAGVPPASGGVGVPPASLDDDSQELHLAPPQESAIPLVPEKPAGPVIHSSRKPITDPPQASAPAAAPDSTPAAETVKLTAALYTDRNPVNAGQPLHLIDCLRAAPSNSRAKAIEAYWTARQIAAQRQGLDEQMQWLAAVGPTLSAQNPPSPTAMLKFRAARLAVESERADAEADCMVAQFELAGLAALGTEKGLPQAASVPFVGRLPLPPASQARSWSQRRLEATLPQRQQAIIDQTAAVVQSNASRAAATADFLAGRSSLERVLAGIELHARETSAFLRAVAEYNRAIAQYAAATLPASTEPEKLAAALMAY
jgi:hypothetical protein